MNEEPNEPSEQHKPDPRTYHAYAAFTGPTGTEYCAICLNPKGHELHRELTILTEAQYPTQPIPGPVGPVRIESAEQLHLKVDPSIPASTASSAGPPAKKPKKKRQPTKADQLFEAAQAVLDAVEEAKQATDAAMPDYEEALENWQNAAEGLKEAISSNIDAVREALENLQMVREDLYQSWYDNMSEGLQASPTGQKLEELLGIDLEPNLPDELVESAAQEILDADLPQGFGRD
jgi:hypothetical protein